MTSRSCSTTITVLPNPTRPSSCVTNRSTSDGCNPVVGSSRTYNVFPRWLRCSSVASLMRCASPPDNSVAGCPQPQVSQADLLKNGKALPPLFLSPKNLPPSTHCPPKNSRYFVAAILISKVLRFFPRSVPF